MYPIAHAMAGLLIGELAKEKRRIALIVGILLGIAPDFDFTFNIIQSKLGVTIPFLMHRNLTHTIFPAAFILGFLTLWIFKSYWMGFLAIGSHWLLDVIDGGAIPYFPGLTFNFKYSLANIIPNYRFERWSVNTAGFNDVTMSAMVGIFLIVIVLGIEYYSMRKQK